MNQNEKTFQDMEKKSISCLNAYKQLWINNEVIKQDVDDLMRNDKELDEVAKIQDDSKPQGQVAQKKQELLTLGKSLYKLACLLRHLAVKTNNKVLLKIVDQTEVKFTSGKENKIILRFEAVLAAARENLTDLAKYNVSATNLDGYDAQLAKLQSIPDSINVASGQRKSATRSIKELNAEARRILELLDDLIEGMMNDEKFIDAWFEARKIKGRHRSVKKEKDSAKKDEPLVK